MRDRLTKRQAQWLLEYASGLSHNDIGTVLGISDDTSRQYAAIVSKKLGVNGGRLRQILATTLLDFLTENIGDDMLVAQWLARRAKEYDRSD